jgi:hypothetical protein
MGARVRIATNIDIDAPIAQVWALLTGFDTYARWNRYIVRIDGAAVSGTAITVHAIMQPGAAPLAQLVDVIAVVPFAMHWQGGFTDRSRFCGDHHFRLDALETGCRFDHFEDFSGTQANAILAVHDKTIAANFALFNRSLKDAAERNAAV